MGNERQAGPHATESTIAAPPSLIDERSTDAGASRPFDFFISAGSASQIAAVLAEQPPGARDELIARVQFLRGNAFAAEVVAVNSSSPDVAARRTVVADESPDAPTATHSEPARTATAPHEATAQDAIDRATSDLAAIATMLLPAYEDAITNLDPLAVGQLQKGAIGVYDDAIKFRGVLRAQRDHGGGMFQPLTSGMLGRLEIAISDAEQQLGRLTARHLGGREVFPGAAPLAFASAKDPAAILRADAAAVVELVATAQQIVALIPEGDGSEPLSASAAMQAAALVKPWRTRPVNFAFLRALLAERGIWQQIEHAAPPFDRSLAEIERDTEAQAAELGATTDVRRFDLDLAGQLLDANATDEADEREYGEIDNPTKGRREQRAMDVLRMLYSTDPTARARILEALERRGHLERLLAALPFAYVEQLHNGLPKGSGHVQSLMRPYFEDKDRSNHSVSHGFDQVPYVGGALKFIGNVATFGFLGEHDQAYAAYRAGTITEDQFQDASGKALGRAAVVGVASYATAGAAGAWADGFTAGMAARSTMGRYAAGVVTSGVEGFAGGLGAQAGNDLVDQRLSDPSDYLKSGGYGAAIGAGVSVVAGVGAQGAKYLPPGVQTFAQKIAARFPHHADIFDEFRALGREHYAATVQLRIKVGRFLAFADDLNLYTARPALAVAGAGGRPLGLDDEVIVTAQATRPFNDPGDLDGPAPITILKAERLPEDLVSHEGDDLASYLGDGPETVQGMHVIDADRDAAGQRNATAAATRSNIGSRTPLAEHIPPPGPAFVEWFDSLTLDELERFLADRTKGGLKGAREVIDDSIRHPGGLHEWVMVKHARQAKRWGVSLQTVIDARTTTVATVGRRFRHGAAGSGRMHEQLDEMIASSGSFQAFRERLNAWADRELFPVTGPAGEAPLGRYYLPPELQIPAEGGAR